MLAVGEQQSVGVAAIAYLTTSVEDNPVIFAVLAKGCRFLRGTRSLRFPGLDLKISFLEATSDSKTTAGGQEHEPNN